MDYWNWPQWTYAVIWAIVVCVNVVMHGKEITVKLNGFTKLANVAVFGYILHAGGFW